MEVRKLTDQIWLQFRAATLRILMEQIDTEYGVDILDKFMKRGEVES